HEAFLDVLPVRASKGHAIRYLSYKWSLSLSQFLVAGDSGNDTEMLLGDTLGVVVSNHSPELETLRGREKIYFAQRSHARGILDGIFHYGFASVPPTTEEDA
ncbi:MAG TPA: HAD family hydrolase, partial [Betaproteobacteria bacterium]|nr:HAD family hydrolase [Betaproteobacteria bacterium]